jgi:hypothetical protein
MSASALSLGSVSPDKLAVTNLFNVEGWVVIGATRLLLVSGKAAAKLSQILILQ